MESTPKGWMAPLSTVLILWNAQADSSIIDSSNKTTCQDCKKWMLFLFYFLFHLFFIFSIFKILGLVLEVIGHISHIWWCGHNIDHRTKKKEVEGSRTK